MQLLTRIIYLIFLLKILCYSAYLHKLEVIDVDRTIKVASHIVDLNSVVIIMMVLSVP